MKEKSRAAIGFRKWFSYVMIIVLMVLMIPAMPSEASAKSIALSKYRALLNKSRISVLPQGKVIEKYKKIGDEYIYYDFKYWSSKASKVKFCIANIDNDSIPELVINCKLGLRSDIPAYTILTYKDGKIKRVTYETYASFKGYYPKTGIYINHHITEGELIYINYIRMKGLRTTEVMYKGDWGSLKYTSDDYKDWYNIGEKDCSAKTFAAYRSKITGGKSLINVKMHSNTATNRNLKSR